MHGFRFFAVATTATAIACGGSGDGTAAIAGGPTTTVDHIVMGAQTATVDVGSQITLTATPVAADGTPVTKTIAWSTASSSIATVTQNGVVTGVAAGLVNIAATAGGKSGHTAVTVVLKGAAPTGDYADVAIVPTTWRTCGRTDIGIVRCWGMNGSGAFGDGTTTDSNKPVQAATTLRFAQIAIGNGSTCGRTIGGGDLYCWGDLGLAAGHSDVSLTPRLMLAGTAFTDISIGESDACGLAIGGAAYCWGYNENGASGDSTRTYHATPVAVKGGLSFAQIAVGGGFACGRTSGGAVYCWGKNQLGQIGDGTTSSDRLAPTRVTGGQLFTTIAASLTYACGLNSQGAIYCWGNNNGVVQGTGTGGQSSVPAIVNSSQKFTQIAAGLFHACALTATGAAWCWGDNINNELGDGSLVTVRTTPVAVAGGIAFAKIAAGHWYTCGVSTFGAMYCWGDNASGNLGDGTNVSRSTPTLVK
jgi:alpha-tubulin suppressor-like RCC1 family protein